MAQKLNEKGNSTRFTTTDPVRIFARDNTVVALPGLAGIAAVTH